MNKTSNILSIILSVVFLGIVVYAILFSSSFNSGTQVSVQDNSREYQITSQTYNATYHKNGTISVEETISVNFDYFKHGITHTLPEISNVVLKNADGTSRINQNMRLEYSSVKCLSNHQIKTSRYDNFFEIRLGSENYWANANETYKFSYLITMDGRYSAYDVYYFNVLGFMTDTTISSFSANITFEEPISPNQQIFMGKLLSQNQISGTWNTENTTLSFSASNLKVGEGITVLVELPQNYAHSVVNNTQDIIMLVLILLAAVLVVVVYNKKSNKSFITPVVQFSAKPTFTSADVGYIIDKKVNTEDIASLIIYWANKGFINIIEEGKKTYISRTDKTFVGKLYEKQLFYAIFDKHSQGEKLDIKKLGNNITEAVTVAKQDIPIENSGIFSKSASFARGALIVLSSFLLTLTLMFVNYQNVNDVLMWCGLFVGVAACVSLFVLAKNQDKQYALSAKKSLLRKFAFFAVMAGVLTFCIISFNGYSDPFGTVFLAFGLVLLTAFIVHKFNVRTDEGCRELGDILGLKNFIEVAEKSRLEMLVKDNPQMFYDVLPYAYVLGVYDKWCKKFESIDIGAPIYYQGASVDVFDVIIFSHILRHATNNFLASVTTANLASVAENIGKSVGGFSGGGGFAGGGAGGGGTGSW